MNKNVIFICQAAIIAALYVVLTMLIGAFASGPIQIRISEALTVLPCFTPAAIPGLTIGCFFANLFTGCAAPDVLFGTLATLLGALGSYALRNRSKWLVPLPPVIANTIIVPFVLRYAYHLPDAIPRNPKIICFHDFVDGSLSEHVKNGKGGCVVTVYKAQRCCICGYIKGGNDIISKTEYTVCPHN